MRFFAYTFHIEDKRIEKQCVHVEDIYCAGGLVIINSDKSHFIYNYDDFNNTRKTIKFNSLYELSYKQSIIRVINCAKKLGQLHGFINYSNKERIFKKLNKIKNEMLQL